MKIITSKANTHLVSTLMKLQWIQMECILLSQHLPLILMLCIDALKNAWIVGSQTIVAVASKGTIYKKEHAFQIPIVWATSLLRGIYVLNIVIQSAMAVYKTELTVLSVLISMLGIKMENAKLKTKSWR